MDCCVNCDKCRHRKTFDIHYNSGDYIKIPHTVCFCISTIEDITNPFKTVCSEYIQKDGETNG